MTRVEYLQDLYEKTGQALVLALTGGDEGKPQLGAFSTIGKFQLEVFDALAGATRDQDREMNAADPSVLADRLVRLAPHLAGLLGKVGTERFIAALRSKK